MSRIIINNSVVQFKDLKNSDWKGLNDIDITAINFCADWINGKEEFILETSGSTGPPKLIHATRRQMSLSAQMTAKILGLEKHDKALVCLNTNYVAGKMMLVRALETGMEMTIVQPSSNPLNQFDINTSFDFTAFVPIQIETILRNSPDKIEILNRMKAVIIGGAAVNFKLEEEIQQIKAPVFSTFGMTETLSHIALRRLNGIERSDFYETLENVTIGYDERNCLTIQSPVTNNELLITNDLVEIKGKNKFKWLGRIDNVINSGGIKVQPEKIELEIEKIFYSQKIKNRFFVTGIPNDLLGESITILIEGNNLNNIEEIVLKKLQKKFPKNEMPKGIIYLDKFIETNNGKINRKLSAKLIRD